jgi:hypothetical protein
MKLKFDAFPKVDINNTGLNDSAILTFTKDVVDSIVRELTQNSLDAKVDPNGKLNISISEKTILTSAIPNIDSLREILDHMIAYWSDRKQPDFVNFFENSKKILNKNTISLFAFEDYNTKGLSELGAKNTLNSLVFDEGVSVKEIRSSLGGFGIGKNAFFTISRLKTVFYTSYNDREGFRFVGVSKLSEYQDAFGEKRSPRLYYAKWNDKVRNPSDLNLVKSEAEIPSVFQRKGQGLSSFALGVNFEDDWSSHAKKSLIKNYWCLFEANKIEASVEGDKIDQEEYLANVSNYFEDGDNATLAYINAYREPDHIAVRSIHKIGDVELRIKLGDEHSKFPNKFLSLRDGMSIKEDRIKMSGLPGSVAGLVIYKTVKGNEIMSHMEPPAHNDFHSELLDKKSDLKKSDGDRILKELKRFRKDVIAELKKQYTQEITIVNVVDELFPGIGNIGGGIGSGRVDSTDDETFNIGLKEFTRNYSLEGGKVKTINILSGEVEEEENVEDLGDGGGPDGSNEGKDGTGKGDGSGTGDGIGGVGKSTKGSGSPKNKRNSIAMRGSFYLSKSSGGFNVYKLVVYTNMDVSDGKLFFTQHGDSNSSSGMTSTLKSAEAGGVSLDFSLKGKGYQIEGVTLKKDDKNVFELKFEEVSPSAFKFIS